MISFGDLLLAFYSYHLYDVLEFNKLKITRVSLSYDGNRIDVTNARASQAVNSNSNRIQTCTVAF